MYNAAPVTFARLSLRGTFRPTARGTRSTVTPRMTGAIHGASTSKSPPAILTTAAAQPGRYFVRVVAENVVGAGAASNEIVVRAIAARVEVAGIRRRHPTASRRVPPDGLPRPLDRRAAPLAAPPGSVRRPADVSSG